MENVQRIFDLFGLLLRKWWIIAIVCLSTGALSAWYIVSIPRSYTATIVMMPEMNDGSTMSGLGSLAAMAGLKMPGGGSEEAIHPELYPKIVRTPYFIADLLKQEVAPGDSGLVVTLYEYLTKYQKVPWWEMWFDGKGEQKVKEDKDGPLTPNINPHKMTKRQARFIQEVSSAIACFVEKRTTMVTIDVTMQDPDVAAQVVELVRDRLQHHITEYRTSKARTDEMYWEGITEKALREYKDAQRKYATFADANQDLVLASVKQEEERLENEMQMAFNTYSQSAQQLQLARAKVQERTPAFTAIQPATVPTKPSAPKRVVFVGMMLLLSFMITAMMVVVWDYRKKQHLSTSGSDSHSADH